LWKWPNKVTYRPNRFKAKLSRYFFSNGNTGTFLSNSDKDLYSENNNVSQVYTYSEIFLINNSLSKLNKKPYCTTLKCAQMDQLYNNFTPNHSWGYVHIGGIASSLCNPICYYLSFVFPAKLILLLHCNAMHFDSFSLDARHLLKKLMLFFYVRL
jgi:hypothetical protein